MPANNSLGVDLMKRISDGQLRQAPSEYVEKVRVRIVEACEELLDIGARIRPLIVGKKQVGWIRGLHTSERKLLDRWIYAKDDLAAYVLAMTTSFTSQEIEDLPSFEVRNLVNIVHKLSDYDVSLFPYLGAYVTSLSSENLWHGKGTRLSSFENRIVEMPDGKRMRILTAPDHARVWATLCTYREQAKKRLDENFNAVLIIRPWAGKSAEPIAAELRSLARTMQANSLEPWQNVIQVKSDVDLEDGWGHPGDSVEDLQRELKGFLEGDKHERLMEKFEKQMRDEAEGRQRHIDQIVQDRGGPGIVNETTTILTDAEVRQREKDLKRGRPVIKPTTREDREVTTMPHEKIQKYR
jgi:hypothetical protein